jgi:hypothetical protein
VLALKEIERLKVRRLKGLKIEIALGAIPGVFVKSAQMNEGKGIALCSCCKKRQNAGNKEAELGPNPEALRVRSAKRGRKSRG